MIEGFQHDEGTPTYGNRNTVITLDKDTDDDMHNYSQQQFAAQPTSTGSSAGEAKKSLVVINYADHVKQQLVQGSGDYVSEQASDRSQSNMSSGYNHAPSSPMRHRSSANVEPGQALAEWPTGATNEASLFKEEFEATDEGTGMAFEGKNSPRNGTKSQDNNDGTPQKFGKEDDADSLVSGHSASRLLQKANLELIWQKANSINGIRKMNMLFKEERRAVTALEANDQITEEYLQICETFL